MRVSESNEEREMFTLKERHLVFLLKLTETWRPDSQLELKNCARAEANMSLTPAQDACSLNCSSNI